MTSINTPSLQANTQAPSTIPQTVVVDFAKASAMQNEIDQMQKILEITKNQRAQLEADYKKETGRAYSAKDLKPSLPAYVPDPNKTYIELINEMDLEAGLRTQGARSDVTTIFELEKLIEKEKAISQYLNNLKEQVQEPKHTVPASSRSQRVEKSPSMLETAAKIGFLAIAFSAIPPYGVVSGLAMGLMSFGLIKIVGNAIADAGKFVLSPLGHSSIRLPQYR